MDNQMKLPHSITIEEDNSSSTLGFGELFALALGFLRRRYLIMSTCLLLSFICAGAYLLVTPPTFTATAMMLIDTRPSEALQSSSGQSGSTAVDPAWLESQIAILKSQSVASYVVKQLKLDEDPAFTATDPGFIDQLIHFVASHIGPDLRKSLDLAPPSVSSPMTKEQRLNHAIGAYLEGIQIRRASSSYIVQIDFRSRHPTQAVNIANAIVDAYASDQLTAKFQANRRATDWLKERLDTLRSQASKAERAVIEYKAKHNIVSDRNGSMNEQQLASLNAQLNTARARTADVKARLDRIESVLRANEFDAKLNETVSDTLNNSIINGLRVQYLTLSNRETAWAAKYGKSHSAVVNLRNQMREIRRSILDEMRRISETYKSELAVAEDTQQNLEKQQEALLLNKQGLSRSEIELRSLESTAQSYRKIYDDFLGRYTEADQRKSLPVTEARLISPAFVQKTHPKLSYVWMIAIVVGGMLGVGFGTLRELFDQSFRTVQQVQSALGIECLAMIPLLKQRQLRTFSGRRLLTHGGGGSRHILEAEGTKALRGAVATSTSPFAEAIRSIRMSVDASNRSKKCKIIGITSCIPHEGKSTVALSVAQLIAQTDERTLLVDFDFRNPSLSRTLAPEAKIGLIDIFKQDNTCTIADTIWTDPTTTVGFLPTVAHRNSPALADTLLSSTVDSFFETIRERYDYVIVDLPPLAPMADVRACARFVDAYVLVIEWGSTKVDIVKRGLSGVSARGVRENIVGAVLNKVDADAIGKYDRTAKYYYDNYGYAA
jgi:polysaccharide biosynthesis transport protein